MKSIKLTVIGGGSSYTPELAEGIIKNHATFPVNEIALVDIADGKEKVEIICGLLQRMFQKGKLDVNVYWTLDRREALQGSDFIISQFRAGGLDARAKDERIPMTYGIIGQETTGPGGFANAMRTIPVALDICRDIEAICPRAWLINFTNPSGIVTEAIHKYSNVQCIGLCNVPINMEREVCKGLGLDKSEVHCMFAGLNHLSFIGRLYVGGEEQLCRRDISALMQGEIVKNITGSSVPKESLNDFGFIPSPYLRYYYLEREMLKEELDQFETTGQTREDEVKIIENSLFEKYRNKSLDEKPEELSKRGGALYSEAAVSLMNSIWNDSSDIQVVNVVNNGCLPELPRDAVIETNCVINRQGATPLTYGALPASIKGLVQQVKAYEQLTVEAAAEKSRRKAYLALLNHPLVHGVHQAQLLLEDIVRENGQFIGALTD